MTYLAINRHNFPGLEIIGQVLTNHSMTTEELLSSCGYTIDCGGQLLTEDDGGLNDTGIFVDDVGQYPELYICMIKDLRSGDEDDLIFSTPDAAADYANIKWRCLTKAERAHYTITVGTVDWNPDPCGPSFGVWTVMAAFGF